MISTKDMDLKFFIFFVSFFSIVLMLYCLYVESSLVGFLRGGWLHTQVQPSPAQEEVSM